MSRAERVGLLVGCLIGVPMMAFGVLALVEHSAASPPSSFLRFFIGGDVIHDALVAPVAALLGVTALRRVPQVARAQLRAALFTTAVVIALAWPGIRAYGRTRAPDNASVQPLNYATAVLTVLAVVWLLCAIWLLVDVRRSRR